jgi:hypothetical protein
VSESNAGAYIEGSRDAAKEFDSRIFWLAGGSIALSLTFYQDLVKQSHVASPVVLFVGWVFLLLAIVVVMVSFQLSVMSCNAFTEFETGDRGNAQKRDAGIRYAGWVTRLNWLALVSVVAGILAVLVFFLLNAGFATGKGVPNAGATEATTSTLASPNATSAP